MILVKVPSGMGSLGQNAGSAKSPEAIAEFFLKKMRIEAIAPKPFDLEATNKLIYEKAKKLMRENCFFLGGDHSITFPLFRAFAELHENPGLVVFDYHTDLGKAESLPTNGTFLRSLIDKKIVKKKNVLLIGTKFVSPEETKYFEEINSVSYTEIKNSLKKATEKTALFLKNFENIHVSIDIDVFREKTAPANPFAAHGGISKKEFFSIFNEILASKKAGSFDLTEISPAKDVNGKTLALARQIIEQAGKKGGFI